MNKMSQILVSQMHCVYCKTPIEQEQTSLQICADCNTNQELQQALQKVEEENKFAQYKDQRNILLDFLNVAQYCKHAYFWHPTGNAANRRRSEEKYTRAEQTIVFGKDTYTFSATMSMSCNNAYFSTAITKNGKKTNIRVLKTLYKKMGGTIQC